MRPPSNGVAASSPSPSSAASVFPSSSSLSSRRFALVAVMSCVVAVLLFVLSSVHLRPSAAPPPLPLRLHPSDPSFVRGGAAAAAGVSGSPHPQQPGSLHPPLSPSVVRLRDALQGRQRLRVVAAELADEASFSVCQQMVASLEIVIGSSWGTASEAEKNDWWLRDCDAVLRLKEYRRELTEQPLVVDPIVVPPDRQSPGPRNTSFDVVAVCVSTTTRHLDISAIEQLSLFQLLLPSIVEKADVGYEYWLYVLYDVGDPFLDQDSSRLAIQQWFDEKFIGPLQSRDIASRLVLSRYVNSAKKPGPAFNYLTHLAYIDGADWIYRINDDSQFMTPFAFAMVTALTALGPPYGVVGPVCNEGAQGILTHDFVHRTHHAIFVPFHYPPPLSDWWMDDWITRVYGKARTLRLQTVVVQHLIKSHGTRYNVNLQHKLLLGSEVESGRQQIERYLVEHEMLAELEAFETDTFKFYV